MRERENKPVKVGHTIANGGGPLVKNEEYYAGHWPKEHFPEYTKVTYTRGLTGLETKVTWEAVVPAKEINVKNNS